MLKDAGCDVQGERVHFPRGLAATGRDGAVATQHARNPARSVEIGGNNMVFAPSTTRHSFAISRMSAVMRPRGFPQFREVATCFPGSTIPAEPCTEPVDLPVTKRHLEMIYAHQRYSDKPYMGSVTAPERHRTHRR